MKKTLCSLALIFIISACSKEINEKVNPEQLQERTLSKKPLPPPPAFNPVFVYRGTIKISGNRTAPAIMSSDLNVNTVGFLYASYTNRIIHNVDFPSWSGNGSKICFTYDNADLYTLDVTVVNGSPIGSNATKVGDGVAAGGSYKQGKWRTGYNEIVCVFKKNSSPDKIHLIPAGGGTAAQLYTAQSPDFVIGDDIAVNPDGSNLVFSERQTSTGNNFLKVLDVNTGLVIKSINMNLFAPVVNIYKIIETDWAKSGGSKIVAITTWPKCDTSFVGSNGIHQLFTIDVGATSPILTWRKNDAGCINFSPDDEQITINRGVTRFSPSATGCTGSQYDGFNIFNLTSQATTVLPTAGFSHHDWKRK